MFNAFELLDLPMSFNVNVQGLEENYEHAQKQIHPDKWAAFPVLIRQSSQGLAARLTQAYQTLKDPVRRGEHLLILKGYWPLPSFPDLMEEMLMTQERIGSHNQKDKLMVESEYTQAYTALEKAFEKDVCEEIQRAYWWLLHISKSHRRGAL
jgi:DnaJ-domain-containing protein 1